MSWDPSAALRDAMEEQLTHLRRTLSAVTPGDEHAEEMQRRLQTQIDDIEGRILKMNRPTGASSSDDVEHQQKVIPNRPPTLSTATEKSDIRAKVWTELRKVALPDSRFHCKIHKTYVGCSEKGKTDYEISCKMTLQNLLQTSRVLLRLQHVLQLCHAIAMQVSSS